tara:strand:+ start:2800 stop:3297 length:498 start_codon:yes stop_codon:yes gene_type:complete
MQLKYVLAAALISVGSATAQLTQIPATQCGPGTAPAPGFFPELAVTSTGAAGAGDQLTFTMTPFTNGGLSAIVIGFTNFSLPLPCGIDPLAPTSCTIRADVEEFFVLGPFPQAGGWSMPAITIPPGLAGNAMYAHGIEFVPSVAGACNFLGFEFALTQAWQIAFQ